MAILSTALAPMIGHALEAETISKTNSKFRTGFVLTYYTDMRKNSDFEKTSYSEAEATLGYNLTDKDSLSLYIPFAKELAGEYNENLNDGKLSYTRKDIYKSDLYHFYFRSSYVYPLSRDSKVKNEMYFGLEINPTSVWSLDGLARGLSFTYLPRIKRSFHKYEYDRTGNSLVQSSLIQYFILDYAFLDNWNYEIAMIYVNSQTYKGRYNDPSYLAVNEISYSSGNYTYLLGLQTGGSLSKPEYGKENSIQFYDSQASEVYAGVSVTF